EEPLAVAEFIRLGDRLVPDDFAAVAIDRDDAAVGQAADDEVFPQRDAARTRRVALVLYAGIGDPGERSLRRIARVDLVNRAPPIVRVHEAVVDERIDLVLRTVLADVLHPAERQRPDHAEVFHVVPIDLR